MVTKMNKHSKSFCAKHINVFYWWISEQPHRVGAVTIPTLQLGTRRLIDVGKLAPGHTIAALGLEPRGPDSQFSTFP